MLAKLKQIADEHPFFVVIGVFALGATTAGVPMEAVTSANHAQTRNLKAEIDRLNTQLAAVTRSVGPESTTELRTDKIVISASQAEDLSPSLDYIEADDVYAPRLESDHEWSFDVTDEAGLSEAAGLATRQVYEKELGASIAHHRVNWWHSDEVIKVGISQGTLAAFPQVAVERINKNLLGEWVADARGNNDLKNFVAEDPLGAMFQLNVVNLASGSTEEFTPILGGIQRAEGALYCDITIVFRDVEIDGVPINRFYLEHEWIFLDARDDVIAITTTLPSTDRRSLGAPVVTELLNGLRIVA